MISLNEIVDKLQNAGINCKCYGRPLSILVSGFNVLNAQNSVDRSVLYITDEKDLKDIPVELIEDSALLVTCPGAEPYPLPKASRLILADSSFADTCNQLIRIFLSDLSSAAGPGAEDDYYSNCPQFCALVHEILSNDIRNRSFCMQKLSEVRPRPEP